MDNGELDAKKTLDNLMDSLFGNQAQREEIKSSADKKEDRFLDSPKGGVIREITPEMLAKSRRRLLQDLDEYKQSLLRFQEEVKHLSLYRFMETRTNFLIAQVSNLYIILNDMQRSNKVGMMSRREIEEEAAIVTELLINIYLRHIE